MVEENSGKDKQQDASGDPLAIAPIPPIPAPIKSPESVPPPQKAGSQPSSQRSEERADAPVAEIEKDLSAFERQMLRATWAAVIVAALTGAILYSQFRVMGDQSKILSDQSTTAVAGAIESERNIREQLKIAEAQVVASEDGVKAIQRQMRQDQRPWLDIQFGDITWAVNQALTVRMTLTNKGKTPAKNLDGGAFVEKISLHEKPHFGRRVSRFGTGMLVPNLTINAWGFYSATAPKTPAIMTKDDIQALLEGRAIAVVHGIITFDDIFDVHHWVRFCSYTPNRALAANVEIQDTAAPCADYQSTDNN